MSDIVLTNITSAYNLQKINDNFAKIQTSLNEDKVAVTGSGNTMDQDLDMNGHRVLNTILSQDSAPTLPNDLVRLVDLNAEATIRSNVDTGLQSQVDLLKISQTSGVIGYATLALLNADLTKPAGTVALVTNDPTTLNNQTYVKSGAPGTGSWVVAIDRIATEAIARGAADTTIVNNLAATTGSNLVGFKNRTLTAKLNDQLSVKDYGAIGDGVANDLTAITTSASTSGYIRLTAGTYLVGANATITVPLKIEEGATISISTGVVLTISGSVIANDSQNIFSGAGNVAGLSYASARWFGAVGNGVTNDTTAFTKVMSALNTNGKKLVIPGGTYVVNSPIAITRDGLHIEGDSKWTTSFLSTSLSTDVFTVSANFFTMEKFAFIHSGTPTAGSVFNITGNNYTMRDFYIRTAYNGIFLNALAGVGAFTDFNISGYVNSGIFFNATDTNGINDVWITNFVLNAGAGSNTTGLSGGFRILNNCQALNFVSGDVIGGRLGISVDATFNTLNKRPSFCKFIGVYVDSTYGQGISLNNCSDISLNDCWSASSNTGSGIGLGVTDSVVIQNTLVMNNAQNGIISDAGTKRLQIKNCHIDGNSGVPTGTFSGISIAPNQNDFMIQGNSISNALGFSGSHKYGIIVNSGTSDRYIIAHNLVSGSVTTNVIDGGTGVNKSVTANF